MLTNLAHTFPADLDITITSPAGTVVTLKTDNGVGNDNVFNGTLWDDDADPAGQVPYVTNIGLVTDHPYANLAVASPLVPEEALAAFIGEDPNGTWTVTISDDLAEDGGSLDSWTLNITTITCETAALFARGSGFADTQASDGRAVESLTCASFRPSANGVVSPAGEPADGDVGGRRGHRRRGPRPAILDRTSNGGPASWGTRSTASLPRARRGGHGNGAGRAAVQSPGERSEAPALVLL